MAIPALREPREDIPLLAEHFIKRFEAEYNKKTLGLFDKAMEACMHYSWPGNIRELENAIERCIILIESISVQTLFPRALEEQIGHSDRISLEGTLVHPQKEDSGWVEQLFASGLSLDEIASC